MKNAMADATLVSGQWARIELRDDRSLVGEIGEIDGHGLSLHHVEEPEVESASIYVPWTSVLYAVRSLPNEEDRQMSFPSEAYINLIQSEEMAWLQELWEPMAGDWMLVQASLWSVPMEDYVTVVDGHGIGRHSIYNLTKYFEEYPLGSAYLWLPRLDQLFYLLKDCGCNLIWRVDGFEVAMECDFLAWDAYAHEWEKSASEPEIAALKLYAAVRGKV